MKKRMIAFALMLLFVPAVLGFSCAEEADPLLSQYRSAETLDEKLALIHRIAAGTQQVSGDELWQIPEFRLADVRADSLLPKDWSNILAGSMTGFPEYAMGRPCIVIRDANTDSPIVAAGIMAHFPADMIAQSAEEAEYLILITNKQVESGYTYNPPATSYHRDYAAYIVNLKTGKADRFWSYRVLAAEFGYADSLDARPLDPERIWEGIRDGLIEEMQVTLPGGIGLHFYTEGGACVLKEYSGNPVRLEIPGAVKGYPVVRIDDKCFYDCRSLISVSLPDSVAEIGKEAFGHCWNLEEVRFPEGLKVISESAFDHTALKEVVLPEGVTRMEWKAFMSCRNLVSVTLPGTLTEIDTFGYCPRLTKMVFGEGITVFPERFHLDQNSNVQYLYLPASLEELSWEHVKSATVYAPEGSYALQWAMENNAEAVPCEDPSEIPEIRILTEGDLDYRIVGEEAQVLSLNDDTLEEVTVPGEVSGYPVTVLLSDVFASSRLRVIRLPESLREIRKNAVEFSVSTKQDGRNAELYIPNPQTTLRPYALYVPFPRSTAVTVFAPAGSPARDYVAERQESKGEESGLGFSEWSGE